MFFLYPLFYYQFHQFSDTGVASRMPRFCDRIKMQLCASPTSPFSSLPLQLFYALFSTIILRADISFRYPLSYWYIYSALSGKTIYRSLKTCFLGSFTSCCFYRRDASSHQSSLHPLSQTLGFFSIPDVRYLSESKPSLRSYSSVGPVATSGWGET